MDELPNEGLPEDSKEGILSSVMKDGLPEIFNPNKPICIARNGIRVHVGDEAPDGWYLVSFDVDILQMSPEKPLSSYNGEVTRLDVVYHKTEVYLTNSCGNSKSLWNRYAVAKLRTHPYFYRIFNLYLHSAKRLVVYVKKLDNIKLTFIVVLDNTMVESDLLSVFRMKPSRGINGHELTCIMRIFNFVQNNTAFCATHLHDVEGQCIPTLFRDAPPETASEFQDFFDRLHGNRPRVKPYKLNTEKIASQLRPYQEDAVRFMIDRELNPQLCAHFYLFFYHIKIDTLNRGPLYYLPNLAVFVVNPPDPILPPMSTCGGVLADEMGLGKTVELLALITSVTPSNVPTIEKNVEEGRDEVKLLMDEMVSQVVASIEGEKGIKEFKKKRTHGMMYYSNTGMPFMPKKKGRSESTVIRCEECGTECIEQRVHWSPHLSATTRFSCPECISGMEEQIPIKSTLIVVPNSIAHQWYEEIKKHVKEDIKIDVYKGVSIDGYKHPHYLDQFDIVITTYDVLTAERRYNGCGFDQNRLRKRSYEMQKSAQTPLFSVKWWRVCLDESQMVERGTSEISKLCKELYTRARWSVTGTPISGSTKDLFGLINFLSLNPLDQEWIFDLLLYNPYRYNAQHEILNRIYMPVDVDPVARVRFADFMSSIMWRTEKKHIETSLGKVKKHLEWVELSPMEERIYSDILVKSKEKVLLAVMGVPRTTLLSSLSRPGYRKLFGALSTIQLFLLTSLTSEVELRDRKRKREKEEGAIMRANSGWNSTTYSPEGLFLRLLRDKKGSVMKAHREEVFFMNGLAGMMWERGSPDSALEYYMKIINGMKEIGKLNEQLGHGKETVFSHTKADEEEIGEEESEGKGMGKALSCDSLQFVHVYRNLQWLLLERPSLSDEKMEEEMKGLKIMFESAWRSYCRVEENAFKEKELEWEEVKKEIEKSMEKMSALEEYIDNLTYSASTVVSERDITNTRFGYNVEQRLGLQFCNITALNLWMKRELGKVKSVIEDMILMIEACIKVCSHTDLDDIAHEPTYRVTDVRVVESPKKPKAMKESDGLKRDVPKKKDFIIITKKQPNKVEKDRARMIREDVNLSHLYERCVQCVMDGEFNARSQELCLFCATQACHSNLQWKDHRGKPSRPMASVLELVERELVNDLKKRCDLEDSQEKCEEWRETLKGVHKFEDYWKALFVTMIERTNRIRELRQCTVRAIWTSRDSEGNEKGHVERSKKLMEAAVRNLTYVYSLKDISSPSSPRECPICFESMDEAWFVFPCAHSNCGRCFNTMIKFTGSSRINCSVCRMTFNSVQVMYVTNKTKESNTEGKVNLSVKLNKIVQLIRSILQNSRDEKILLFTSQSVGLEVLMDVMKECHLPFAALVNDNAPTVLNKFRNDPSIRILLMKYDCGGKGLNLTVANHIIFADIVEDPALEKQAIGRCDRIGQKREVNVYYVVAKDTIEEDIYDLTRLGDSSFYKHDNNWTVGTLLEMFSGIEL